MAEEGEAVAGPSKVQEELPFVDSDEVESVVPSLLSDGESVALEVDEDEDPLEFNLVVFDEEALVECYMPPNEAGCAASVAINMGWVCTCLENGS